MEFDIRIIQKINTAVDEKFLGKIQIVGRSKVMSLNKVTVIVLCPVIGCRVQQRSGYIMITVQ